MFILQSLNMGHNHEKKYMLHIHMNTYTCMHVHNYTQVCIRIYVYINARELGAFKLLSFEGNCFKVFFLNNMNYI